VGEVADFFTEVDKSLTLDLLGVPLQERPAYYFSLLPKLLELRSHTGRPHWIIVDEAHHMLPGPWDFNTLSFPKQATRLLYITLDPASLPPPILHSVDLVVAVGQDPHLTLAKFAELTGRPAPAAAVTELKQGEVCVWMPQRERAPFKVKLPPNRTVRQRHSRKYAEGELQPSRSFYFRGPEEKLNLRAQNVIVFTQLAEGVDAGTWLHHLRRHDYSAWFKQHVKDSETAFKIEAIENDAELSAEESLKRVRAAIEETYTLPETVNH
jgi:hypothetical protein